MDKSYYVATKGNSNIFFVIPPLTLSKSIVCIQFKRNK